jgi:predicted Zn-dependent protease
MLRAGLLLAAVTLAPVLHAESGEARGLLARSLAASKAGNVTGARALANAATRADPSWGLAHAVAARAALATRDGAGAEAALGRAREAGFDMKRTRQLMGHARLLQGDARMAIKEADAALPNYRPYALRVRAAALAEIGDPAAAKLALTDAIAASPANVETWVDVGRFRQSTGDIVGAIEAADRAVSLDNDNVGGLLLRGQLVRGQYGLLAALPWFEEALTRDPNNYDVLIDYAATLGDAGRATAMLDATRRALAVRPGSPRAMYLLAVLASRAGDTDLARALLLKTGDQLAGMPGPLLLGATLDIDAGGYEQAVGKLRNLIALQPMNLGARRLLGYALLRSDAAKEALEVLRPLALRADADSYTLTLVARAFERIGERGFAARYLDRAASPGRVDGGAFGADDSVPVLSAAADRDPPGEPSTTIPLIRSLLDANDGAAALARAQAVAGANPGSPNARIVLGDTLMSLGQVGQAAAAYQAAAAAVYDEPTMLRLTGALDMSGDRRSAAEALALFLSQHPRNVAALRLAAHWQIAAGEFDAAIATLEGLRARLGDRDAAMLADLALAYDGDGASGPARSFATAAYRLQPGNAAAVDAYGWAMFGAGDAGGALQLLQKAVTIAPRHAGIRWHLAQVYAAVGKRAEARAQASAALTDPRFEAREDAQKLVAATG